VEGSNALAKVAGRVLEVQPSASDGLASTVGLCSPPSDLGVLVRPLEAEEDDDGRDGNGSGPRGGEDEVVLFGIFVSKLCCEERISCEHWENHTFDHAPR